MGKCGVPCLLSIYITTAAVELVTLPKEASLGLPVSWYNLAGFSRQGQADKNGDKVQFVLKFCWYLPVSAQHFVGCYFPWEGYSLGSFQPADLVHSCGKPHSWHHWSHRHCTRLHLGIWSIIQGNVDSRSLILGSWVKEGAGMFLLCIHAVVLWLFLVMSLWPFTQHAILTPGSLFSF